MADERVFKRHETKYLLTQDQRASLERLMSDHMVDDPHGPSTTRSVYFDTPDFLLARRSLDSHSYKEKVRLRSYRAAFSGDPVFLELKKKCKGVTYKRRVETTLGRALAFCRGGIEPADQIERELAYTFARYGSLRPAVLLAYERRAYFGRDDETFRMTLDRNIRYRTKDVTDLADTSGNGLLSPGMSLLEVKCAVAMPLWLVDWLADMHLYKTSFSKYGMAYRHELCAGRVRLGDRVPLGVSAPQLAAGVAPLEHTRAGRHAPAHLAVRMQEPLVWVAAGVGA